MSEPTSTTHEQKDFHALSDRRFAIASTIAVVIGIVGGFWLLGSPNRQRLISLDNERVQNLSEIARQLQRETGGGYPEGPDAPLPEQLSDEIRNRSYAQDPVTGEVYEYRKLSDDAYELCSTFATDTRSNPGEQRNRYNEWLHPEGRHCFEIKRNAAEP